MLNAQASGPSESQVDGQSSTSSQTIDSGAGVGSLSSTSTTTSEQAASTDATQGNSTTISEQAVSADGSSTTPSEQGASTDNTRVSSTAISEQAVSIDATQGTSTIISEQAANTDITQGTSTTPSEQAASPDVIQLSSTSKSEQATTATMEARDPADSEVKPVEIKPVNIEDPHLSELRKTIVDAVAAYHDWYNKNNRILKISFFHRHGRDGQERAKKLAEDVSAATSLDQIKSQLYIHFKRPKARLNPHSLDTFIIHRIAKHETLKEWVLSSTGNSADTSGLAFFESQLPASRSTKSKISENLIKARDQLIKSCGLVLDRGMGSPIFLSK